MTNARPWILGVSSGFHNGAACLCHGDEIVVAMQEERLTRRKRDPISFSKRSHAVDYCLAAANIQPADLDLIVDCNISLSPPSSDEPAEVMLGAATRAEFVRIPHHLGHALSVFWTSGLDESAILVIDGGGSFGWALPPDERKASLSFDESLCEHLSLYHATREAIVPIEKHLSDMSYQEDLFRGGMPLFRSFGHMFSSVALQMFGQYLEAGKVMALAPFGTPVFPCEAFFETRGGAFEFSDEIPRQFPHNDRWPLRQQEYQDLAASVQIALECGMASLITRLKARGLSENLCYAGGVALNSVANHKILRTAGFKELYVIPAAEDSGTAIGAAYYGVTQLCPRPKSRRLVTDALGRGYSLAEVDAAIARMPQVEVIDTRDPIETCVDLLCDGQIVGWFQGGAEFGPRALGHRSILCDPRRADAKDVLNRLVKHRESFRPFAPAVLAEHASEWFSLDEPNDLTDFMLEICPFRTPLPGPDVPGVFHVDGTGRLQTVTAESNPPYHAVIEAFHRRTGVPMIVNTSMNIMGEPIAETPRDALWLLLFTGVDYCVLEQRVVRKARTFTSVLDLVPLRTIRGAQALSPDPAEVDTVHFSDSAADEKRRHVLSVIDNQSSFRTLLSDSLQSPEAEAALLPVVGFLFRRSLIDFVR
jgi:carbamoyltransferase